MNTRLFILPALALGGAALVLAPARPSSAFSKIGGLLDETQRDVRVFNNLLDATANDNVVSPSQFPGWDGAELAFWKGAIEWSSRLHGDGTGDPQSGNTLGTGLANFDPMFAGHSAGVGGTNDNIVSGITTCGGGGTLAFTETPISNGWRIRFCDEWNWDDGPGTIGGRFDLQGVMCHEYGHALGLGHSAVAQATMAPAVSAGSTAIRSIAGDDVLGIQCIYGLASATKPTIVATVANAGTLTIYGTNFGATGNEVWFTNATTTTTGIDPIVRVTGVSSNGTVVSVTIPGNASPGDVIVNKSGAGGATLSNAFPTDLVGTFGIPPVAHPNLTNVTPSTIDALIPGTAQTITLSGTDLDLTTSVTLDAVAIDAARWTIVDPSTITLDMPQAATIGAHNMGVSDGVLDQLGITIMPPATPKFELGNGDSLNVVDRDNGLTLILSGFVGTTHRLFASSSNLPSVNAFVSFNIGNNFTDLADGGSFVIPASGWLQITVPTGALVDPGPGPGFTFHAQTFEQFFPAPFDMSNSQSMVLVQ
ncbi:MAG: matrixin family metalloprotease [Planctomycetes bacterium]|nr:matrixin family metalloprotease [Planctomycetota bacterium]